MEQWLESFARAGFLRSADTAHDLKTPLNVAVLNLELLRMRVKKLAGTDEDAKLNEYSRALELELRRMALIFDTFFLLSTPPKGEGAPAPVDAVALCREACSSAGLTFPDLPPCPVLAHEARIRQALRMFFEGADRVFAKGSARLSVERTDPDLVVTVTGLPASPDLEIPKLLKFYYSDPQGNPELSLAAARLIAETYGGGLNATLESDKVSISLRLPSGEE